MQPLNIGAGQTYLPGFLNIDLDPKADITLDLGADPLPFEDDVIELVFSYHTLEHVPDLLHALSEIHRVLKHDGTLLLGLPYATSTIYHIVNPYHLHSFNEYAFDLFDSRKLKGSAVEMNRVEFQQAWVRFDYFRGWRHLPGPLRTLARRHLLNVVRWFDLGLVAVKQPAPVNMSAGRAEMMRRQFDDCLRARRRYEHQPMTA